MIARPPADRLDDFGQHVDRADALVELAPAMVRHIDAIDPVLDRDLGVLGGGDALQDQRDVDILLDPVDVAPVELRLVDAGVAGAHAAAQVALGDVALAPAIAVGVDGQAEGVVALVNRAADMVVDPVGVAAHVKLEDLEAVAGGLRGLVQTGMRHRGEDHAVAELRASPRRRWRRRPARTFRASRPARTRPGCAVSCRTGCGCNRCSTRRAIPAAGSRSHRAPAGCAPASSRFRSRRSDNPNCCGRDWCAPG